MIAGILMIVLAALGTAWWWINVGGGAVTADISPFNVSLTALGSSITSPLISYLCLGVRLLMLVAGGLMLLGSLLPRRWWSRKLVKFGSTKLLWMIIMLVVMVILATFTANKFLSSEFPGLELPYISGSTTATFSMEEATATVPISMGLTPTFFLVIVIAGLALSARIYHGRLLRKLGPRVEAAPKPKPKEKPPKEPEEKPEEKPPEKPPEKEEKPLEEKPKEEKPPKKPEEKKPPKKEEKPEEKPVKPKEERGPEEKPEKEKPEGKPPKKKKPEKKPAEKEEKPKIKPKPKPKEKPKPGK
jgi:hypothetical protein